MASPRKLRVQAKDFAQFRFPRALALNPKAPLLAYTEQWCDYDKKKYFSNLHVLNTQTGEARQWTFGEHGDRSPVWSADGSKLAFLRAEKGEDKIFIISRDGGEPACVFHARGSIAAIKWALKDTAILARFRKADPNEEAEKAIKEGKEPPSQAPASRRVPRLFYRLDGDGFFPEERYHLFLIRLKDNSVSQLTRGKADVEAPFDVSPDGSTVAFVMNAHRELDTHPFHLQVHLLNLKTEKRRSLELEFGAKEALAFSPDGKYLAYIGHHNINDAWGVERLHPYLVDLKSGKERNLTPKFDRQAADETIGDLGYGLGGPQLFWSGDSKKLYYFVSDEGDTHVARVGVQGGAPQRVWSKAGQAAVLDVRTNSLTLVHVDFDSLGTIHYCTNLNSPRLSFKKLTEFNADYMQSHEFGKVRELRFKSTDGTPLHGWIVTPPDFKRGRKYPAIIEIHGGPRAQYGRVFFHEMQYLAASGYVVMFTNPRGSQGYGMKFADAITARWGSVDFEDLMAATDLLEKQAFVDKKRIGVTGGSYGGYLTNIAIGKTQRFKAAVTQRSVVDLFSFVGTSDIGYLDHYEFGGYSWDNVENYKAMNPLSYVDNMHTPLLISHSECDYRCPIEQAEQLFAQLKLRKRTVEFLRFPEEPHGLSRGGRPDRRVIRLEAIREWFDRWMKNKHP